MNEITKVTLTAPMPKLAAARAAGGLKVRVEWEAGNRVGKREVVDLAPLIHSLKFYKKLRQNPKLFRTVHLIRDGRAIAWGKGSEEIDLAATSVERLAEEAMNADELRNLIQMTGLTHAELASAIGRSRRQIENYLAGNEIPRIVGLACFGYSLRKRQVEAPVAELIRLTEIEAMTLTGVVTGTPRLIFKTSPNDPTHADSAALVLSQQ
jgi:hypothetical protein